MDLIEQAIFLVDRKQPENSCQILDVTPGIHQVDLNEMLSAPLDFQLNFEIHRDETNPLLFFHSLPSGAYVLGKVIYENSDIEQEISQYFIHFLVVTNKTLKKFYNNSIFLYKTLLEKTDFRFFEPDGQFFHIRPFALEESSELLDRDLFIALQDFPGPAGMATMVRSCIDSICSFFSNGPPPIQLLSGLIQCFPIHLRPDISFSTGLLFSQAHPIRVMTVDSPGLVTQTICRDYVVPLFSFLRINQLGFENDDSRKYWPQLIYRVFETGDFDFLSEKLREFASESHNSEHELILEWPQLQKIGQKLLFELDAKNPQQNAVHTQSKITSSYDGGHFRTDGIHPVFVPPDQLPVENSGQCAGPQISTTNLSKIYPDWVEEFRKMDSLTARALFGDHVALDALEKHWKAFSSRLTYLERGRIGEAYIHLIQSVLTQPRDPDFPKHPRRSIDALEVLNIFIDEH